MILFKSSKPKTGDFFQRGAIALPSILLLSLILLAAGLAMIFSGYTQNSMIYDRKKAVDAFYFAESGARDALEKISRNRDYGVFPISYSLPMDGGQTEVEISVISAPAEGTPGQTRITSAGIAENNSKKIEVIASIDINGKTSMYSWKEL